MARKTAPVLPQTEELLRQFGDRLRLARLRRRLSAKQVAERAGMAPMTLRSLERGATGVTMGAYLAVMQVLGLANQLSMLATEDVLGRALQDARLSNRHNTAPNVRGSRAARSSHHAGATTNKASKATPVSAPARRSRRRASLPQGDATKAQHSEDEWTKEAGYLSSTDLAKLVEPYTPATTRRR